jgi:hypothetical protein
MAIGHLMARSGCLKAVLRLLPLVIGMATPFSAKEMV